MTILSDFSDLGLSAPILGALVAEGYAAPTPIQLQAIPPVLGGRDLCGIAQTGTGKTAAFALPILQRLSTLPQRPAAQTCRALVLSPTRELASQIADSFRAYGAGLRLSTAVVFGGVPIGRQRQQLARGVDILVATPGRLLDLIDTRSLTLSNVQVLVLDEADRMLDLGFVHALRRIVKLLPRQRQTLLFSATMPRPIAALAEDYLNDPVKVVVAPAATTVERVDQGVVFVPSDRKRDLLTKLLRDPAFARVLVFTRTKHGADRVVRHLITAGIAIAFCSDEERAYLRDIEKLTRCSLRAIPAPAGMPLSYTDPVERSAEPARPRDDRHALGRSSTSSRSGSPPHPRRTDGPNPRRDETRVAGALPAFLHRQSPARSPRHASRPPGRSAV